MVLGLLAMASEKLPETLVSVTWKGPLSQSSIQGESVLVLWLTGCLVEDCRGGVDVYECCLALIRCPVDAIGLIKRPKKACPIFLLKS